MPSVKKRKALERDRKRRQLRLWGAVAGVVVALAVFSVLSSLGGETAGASSGQTHPVSATGAALPPLPTSGTDPAIGMPAPTLAGRSFTGEEITIDPGSTGAPSAIWFVAHWCPHCQAEVPRIVSLAQAGGVPEAIDVYAVSTSVDPAAPNYPPSAWLESVGWPFPSMADDRRDTAGHAYGLSSFPFLVMTDANGTVVGRHAGELGDDGLAASLEQLT
jgi:thiol-disulfide isomerase/thioredoxin